VVSTGLPFLSPLACWMRRRGRRGTRSSSSTGGDRGDGDGVWRQR
jgi:hypothetical protein